MSSVSPGERNSAEKRISPARLRERGLPYWQQVLAGGLYTGLSPIASGTVASAVALGLYYLPGGSNPAILLGAAFVAFVIGMTLADRFERAIGPDPSFFTLDEFVGQWIALASPFLYTDHPYWPILAFFTFRLFDIAKTWPARWFDNRGGALGIMADDVVAGIYANLCSHLIWTVFVLAGPAREFFGG